MNKSTITVISTKVIFYGIVASFLIFLLLNSLFPLKVKNDYSVLVHSSQGELIHAFLNETDKWRMFIELNEITPTLKSAILQKEDRFFYWHPGINPFSVARAVYQNLRSGEITSGASTITMQVTRLLQPKERTIKNKVIEAFRALQLEWKYSKDEILQLYLNLVPFGGNIEGVKAASYLYLGKNPAVLSLSESAALSLIPNQPGALVPGKNNEAIETKRNKWLKVLFDRGAIEEEEYGLALSERFSAFRREPPKHVPHLSYRLKYERKTYSIFTNIVLKEQLKIRKILQEHVQALYHRNIKNAACLVIENHTRNVIAYIGSADFQNTEDAGQVDGTRSLRSPGSTLKPFIYALAMDRGLITPKSVINDVEVNYSGYQPENYDDKFYGMVSIEFALANSLNVPAVKILSNLGMSEFLAGARRTGLKHLVQNENKIGLSIALGGYGSTLEEIAGLYASFPNGGWFEQLNYSDSDSLKHGVQAFSKGSAFMVSNILTKPDRPDLPFQWQNAVNLPKVAWKTGTSYGRKDAWSVGFNRQYTIAVWVGNFSGEGVPYLSGAEVATPLMFKVFNALPKTDIKTWFEPPEELHSRFVCAKSGNVPSANCSDQILDFYLPDISSSSPCNHEVQLTVSKDSSVSYCTTCRPSGGYLNVRYPNYHPELIAHYEKYGVDYTKWPVHNPLCERIFTKNTPHILSPSNGTELYLDKSEKEDLLLLASAQTDVKQLYWYINDRYFGSSGPNENLFYTPQKGKQTIACVDDKGRKSEIQIEVKLFEF